MRLWLVSLALALGTIDWSGDLDVLQRELPKLHPNAFHAVSRETWESAIGVLRERAPSMPPAAVAIEISRIVAMIGDGHTRLTLPVPENAGFFTGHTPTPMPPDPALHFHQFPLRFFWYDDGLYVSAATRPELVGRRVIDGDRLTSAVAPIVAADNDSGRRQAVADALAVPEVWQALGLEPRIRLQGGEEVALQPTDAAWAPQPDPRVFHCETSGGIVHFVYNEIGNDKSETLAAFLGRMMPVVERSEALVIDLRENPGGNGAFNRVLLHALIRSNRLREPGRLFVLTGRRTFSAATDLCVRLEQETSAFFVGEPTGGRPNGYGDSRKLKLPSSGLTVRVSTLYWQPSDPRDTRDAVVPEFSAPPARGRDAAMDEVRRIVSAMRKKGTLDGEWTGILRVDYQRVPLKIVGGKFDIPDLGTGNWQPATRVGEGVLFGRLTIDGRDYYLTASRW